MHLARHAPTARIGEKLKKSEPVLVLRQISLSNPRLALHWPVREANLGGPTRARSRGGGGGTRGLARFDRAPCSRKQGYSAGVARRYPRRVSGRASGPAATSPRTRPTPIFTSVTTSTVTKGRKRGGGVSGGGGGGSHSRGRLSRRPRFLVDLAPPLATIWETMNARVSPSEGGKNTGPYESNCRARGIRAACATVKTRTSTSQNNELMSSSLAPSIFFVVFPAVDRGPLFSEVLLLFGIGIAGGAPSSPEFSCFIPGEAARVSAACASVSTCVAIERGRVWPGPFVHSENAARRSGARGGVRPGGSGKQKKSAFFRTPVQ